LEYICDLLPWAHGHQLKAIATFVAQILDKNSGCQAKLARGLGNQEAACKRLSRLLHNRRLSPNALADAVFWQMVSQLPETGRVRLALDWTSEDTQHLLVISLVVGRRALPLYWRAYDSTRLKGRMRRYESALLRRVITQLSEVIETSRLLMTADRGFADVQLFSLLQELDVEFIIRVKASTKVYVPDLDTSTGTGTGTGTGQWRGLGTFGFSGNTRQRNLGHLLYCASSPQQLWVTMSRARNRKGGWGVWYLVSNRLHRAKSAAQEYGRRFGCEEGFRDVKWWLGFKEARVTCIHAWSRLFALFAISLLVATTLGMALLVTNSQQATQLLRRVTSRRRARCELALVQAVVALLQEQKSLLDWLYIDTKLDLEAQLSNVS
jgi:hypothetical protein